MEALFSLNTKRLVMRKIIMASVITLFLSTGAFAGVFDLYIESEGQTFTDSFTSVQDMIDNIDTDRIKENLSNYTDNSAAFLNLGFRGLPIYLEFVENSTTLKLLIPSIGVERTFTGTDRDDTADLLEDWFKSDGDDAITDLMQALIAKTPVDPVAGNPHSLMDNMVDTMFNSASDPTDNIELNAELAGETDIRGNLITLAARFEKLTRDGYDSNKYTLPLAYTVRFDKSQNFLKIDLPLTMVDLEGSESYSTGLGFSLGLQINNNWRITPNISYGVSGSVDLGAVGQMGAGAVTSSYRFKKSKYTFSIDNMVGYFKTFPVNIDEYSIDAEIENTSLKNGLSVNIPVGNYSVPTSLELFIKDTRHFGSELFIDQYNEIGLSYGYDKHASKQYKGKMKSVFSSLRIGATYLTAKDADGFSINFGYVF